MLFRSTRRRTRPLRAACAYSLQEGQSRRSHRLPCGLDLEVIAQHPPTPVPTPGTGRSERPPLVFVHGSFHAAWCWAERWLPFFSRAGFPCFALSLRAQVARRVNISELRVSETENCNKVSEKQKWLEMNSDNSMVDAVA